VKYFGKTTVLCIVFAAWPCLAEPLDEYWSLATVEDSTSYQTVTVLTQHSAITIRDEKAEGEVSPILEFRCGTAALPALRIDWKRFISSFNTEAGFRADGGKATWLKLGVDQSNKITLSKSDVDVEKLLGRVAGARTLEIEIAPYSEAPVFAKFDISTLDSALASLKAACP
jgi:hypothetical protein